VKPRAGARGIPLARALSKLGLATRSEARELIEQRRVRVDGRLPPNPAMLVVPEQIRVTIDGTHQTLPTAITVALHKPRGVVTTRRDP
jgi:23S rRNA pseudouridine2605 synthase